MTYIRKVAIAIDQLGNALIGGYPDESISAHAYRWRRDGKTATPAKVINAIFFTQLDHCHAAYLNECKRRQLPPEYRQGTEAL